MIIIIEKESKIYPPWLCRYSRALEGIFRIIHAPRVIFRYLEARAREQDQLPPTQFIFYSC